MSHLTCRLPSRLAWVASALFGTLVTATAPAAHAAPAARSRAVKADVQSSTFQSQTPAGYVSRIDGSGQEEVYESCTDVSGNVYVVGRTSSTVASVDVIKSNSASTPGFDRTASTSMSGGPGGSVYYLFVTKYDRDGNVVWTRTAGGPYSYSNGAFTVATGVAVDASGNVFVTGSYGGPTTFGTISVQLNTDVTGFNGSSNVAAGQLGRNLFVAMLSPSGLWQWVKPLAANFYETDASSSTLYGFSGGQAPPPVFRNGGPAGDTSGNPVVRPQGNADGHALVLAPDGSLYVKGIVEDYGNYYTGLDGSKDRIMWMRLSGTGLTNSNRVAIASSDSGGTIHKYTATSFVAKLAATAPALGSPAGTPSTYNWTWVTPVVSGAPTNGSAVTPATTWDTTNASSIGGLAADTSSVFLTGTFTGKNMLSGGSGTAARSAIDGYVARLNAADGMPVYLGTYCGGTNLTPSVPNNAFSAVAGALVIDDQDNAYITGQIRNAPGFLATYTGMGAFLGVSGTTGAAFQKTTSTTHGSAQRPFVAKVDATGVWQWVEFPDLVQPSQSAVFITTPYQADTQTYGWATSLARDSTGSLYVGGCLGNYVSGGNALSGLAQLNFNNPTPLPPVGSPFAGVVASLAVNGPTFDNPPGAYGTNSTTAYLIKLTEADANTRYWRWAMQGTNTNLNGSSHLPVGYDTGSVVAGSGGTVYWSVNDLLPGYASDFAGGNRSGGYGNDTYDVPTGTGSFVLPILADAAGQAGTFSVNSNAPIGIALTPPDGVKYDSSNHPLQPAVFLAGTSTDASSYFRWDSFAGRLYPIAPVVADVRWTARNDTGDLSHYVSVRVAAVWGSAYSEVTGAGPQANEPTVDLQPDGIGYTYQQVLYQDNGTSVTGRTLTCTNKGSGNHSVLLYTVGANSSIGGAAFVIRVFASYDYRDGAVTKNQVGTPYVGTVVDPTKYGHFFDASGRNGYIVNAATGPYDGYGPDAAYNATTRLGNIVPVNTGALTVIWSLRTPEGVSLPNISTTLNCQWPPSAVVGPQPANQIVVTSQLGSEVYGQTHLDPAKYGDPLQVYNQPDRTLPGYNPNEEHAFLATTNLPGVSPDTAAYQAVFALRNDLNNIGGVKTSDPWTLLRYTDPADHTKKFLIYSVTVTQPALNLHGVSYPAYNFSTFYAVAGNQIVPPYPLSQLGNSPLTVGSGVPYFRDRTGQVSARSAGTMVSNFYYPKRANFWYDPTASGTQSTATQIPWLDKYYAANYSQTGLGFTPPPTAPPANTPVPITYSAYWPDDSQIKSIPAIAAQYVDPSALPMLHVGDTLTKSIGGEQQGLFDVEDAFSVDIIYDQNDPGIFDNTRGIINLNPVNDSVRLYDYTAERAVPLNAKINGTNLVVDGVSIPVEFASFGRYAISGLPYQLKVRVLFDATQGTLLVTGSKDATVSVRPLLLPNVLSTSDLTTLQNFYVQNSPRSASWDAAAGILYTLTRDPNGTKIAGGYGVGLDVARDAAGKPILTNGATTTVRATALGTKAISANTLGSDAYIMLVENNAATSTSPVALHLFKVVNPPVIGEVKVIQSTNKLEEKITLRHSSDFGGNTSDWDFDWYYQTDPGTQPTLPGSNLGTASGSPTNPSDTAPSGWTPLVTGQGLNEVVIQGSGTQMLQDAYYICRYRHHAASNPPKYTYWAGSPGNSVVYPGGAVPLSPNFVAQYAPGWLSRVVKGIGLFEQQLQGFSSAPVSTYSSVIQLAGKRYEGPVALTPNNIPGGAAPDGFIEFYQTVLERGLSLSVNNGSGPAYTNGSVNNELLLAATRVSDLYMLLGNEAFADSQDPTVGITTSDGTYSSLAPTLFAFKNQVPSLMQEELCLLRGRDNTGTTTGASPVYNRLYWNFTSGLEGEPVYVNTYNITDQNSDGHIDASDAAILYPQGHGDAWGYYLSAVKEHYRLLRHPNYVWIPRAETTLVQGIGVEVDYFDEQKFAVAAAARANAGAEIVNLTYRSSYVADPSGQWQGYADTDRTRAWGVDDWARRAGQGAYFDWVTATAILPANQTNLLPPHQSTPATGLSKIDRTTVGELANIAANYTKIQGQMDQADAGLNPLGLSPGAIPFDIDPTFLQVGSTIQGNTHFEQIMQRATAATSSALQIFNYANDLTNRLRQVQLSANQFAQDSLEQEFDYKNQLITIFGYPYAGDVGPTGTYPTGYDGPDIFHYNYVAVNDVSGSVVAPVQNLIGFFAPMGMEYATQTGVVTAGGFTQVTSHFFTDDVTEDPATAGGVLHVTFPITTAADWTFVAPATWGSRKAPGTLQMAINDMVTAEANLRHGAVDYRNQVAHIQDLVDLLNARSGIQAKEIALQNTQNTQIQTLNDAIVQLQSSILALDAGGQVARDIADATVEGIPKAEGVDTDFLAPVRGVIKGLGYGSADVLAFISNGKQNTINQDQADETNIANETQLSIQKLEFSYETQQQLKEIEQQLRELIGMRLDLFTLQQALNQSVGSYQQIIAQGFQLLQARQMYQVKVLGAVQLNRYQDLTFRVFRNDALQKYAASFDLASKYTYLAATAYDYETCLLGTSTTAGQRFLTDIVSERSLGQFGGDGTPIVGSAGLSDPMARLQQNFAVLKSQLGINNPQFETGSISLRNELYRILPGANDTWRSKLQSLRVDNLWSVPEFRRYCKPFAPESAGPQPGLVIPFNSDITFGYNFFHQELAGGDSSYDSSRYATKISSVGVYFTNYNGQGLSTTPRVYLVPVGTDVLRTPNGPDLTTREFDVIDQAIPTPSPVGNSDLANAEWIPQNNDLNGPLSAIRQFSRFLAYGDSFSEDQVVGDTRLIGRSIWNTRWLLIIPGGTFLNNAGTGLDTFISGQPVKGSTTGARDGNGVSDIKLLFQTYSYSGD